jgi:hypothetical protein
MLQTRLARLVLPITLLALLAAGCAGASTAPPGDGGDASAATDSGGAVCIELPAYLGFSGVACGNGPIAPGYPAGAPCSNRCDQCHPSHGDGHNCVCDGAHWVCPSDTGCTATSIDWSGGAPPGSCP